jgi:mannosyltransferase OCH1-like enzyme
MQQAMNKLALENPEFEQIVYNQTMARDLIKNNFPSDVLYAFDIFKPSSYKSDLFRYCVLYLYGGMYMDMKYKVVPGFKLIELTRQEHWYDTGMMAFAVATPKNPVLERAIKEVANNAKMKWYGENVLDPTGPSLLHRAYNGSELNFDLRFEGDVRRHTVLYRNRTILVQYATYRTEQDMYQSEPHYSILWHKRDIYYNETSLAESLSK